MRAGSIRTKTMGERRRHLLEVFLGFGLSFAAIAYVVEVLGTQGIGCIAVLGVYCNRYPEGFLPNLLLRVPSDSPWALPLTLLWWAMLSVPQGLLMRVLHDVWEYRRRSRPRSTRS